MIKVIIADQGYQTNNSLSNFSKSKSNFDFSKLNLKINDTFSTPKVAHSKKNSQALDTKDFS